MVRQVSPTALKALEERLRALLRVDIRRETPALADALVDAVVARFGDNPTDFSLRRWLCPQWVVLAAGRGTRMDPSGRLNKNLDVWFGSRNTLQLACQRLLGDRPPIIVVNRDMTKRLLKSGVDVPLDTANALPPDVLDKSSLERWVIPDAVIAIQPVPNGTAGALRSAEESLNASDAETLAVAFGDESFLDRRLFLETFLAHVLSGADATLCGKRPESVVDKGGLFFDDEGRFRGTIEWYDMTPEEQEWMRARLAEGNAITNTGISFFRRVDVLRRFDRLTLHKGGTELHHVDFFRIFYEDGLKTHAHVYDGDIRSGVNRWSNVVEGEAALFAATRRALVAAGARVEADAKVSLDADVDAWLAEGRLGIGCVLAGRVHLGANVTVGDYCYIENSTLLGEVVVGRRTRLVGVTARNLAVADADDGSPVGAPVRTLNTLTELTECRLDAVAVGEGVRLNRVTAECTVIPPHLTLTDRRLGRRRDPSLGMPYVETPTLYELVGDGYIPGMFVFGEKQGSFDWDGLRTHVLRMVREELTPRATSNPKTQNLLRKTVDVLLDARFEDTYLIDALTPEELWGVIFELSVLVTGNADPYRVEKRRSRAVATELLEKCKPRGLGWDTLLRLDIVANLIDFTSARVLDRLRERPNYFIEAFQAAVEAPLAIDSRAEFHSRLFDGAAKRVLWLTDNDGETVFDLWILSRLAEVGHQLTIATRSLPLSNDATVEDVRKALEHPLFLALRNAEREGRMTLMSSGSGTAGTNLYHATPEFVHALRDADIVIAKGQGNWYTLQGLKKDCFFVLMSKGLTAERSTGIIADPNATVDGLIFAFVPRDSGWTGPLKAIAIGEIA
jgi:hypothetical protein